VQKNEVQFVGLICLSQVFVVDSQFDKCEVKLQHCCDRTVCRYEDTDVCTLTQEVPSTVVTGQCVVMGTLMCEH